MCLITRQKKAKILKKNLTVYKVVLNNNGKIFSSFQQDYEWMEGDVRTQSINITTGLMPGNYTVADDLANSFYRHLSNCVEIDKGFHGCLTIERAELLFCETPGEEIRQFIIPVGSEVYYDITGLVVANQMMLIKTQ